MDTQSQPNDRNSNPLARWLVGLALAAVDVYVIGLLLFLLVRLLTGERLWPVALANNLLAWAMLPSLPLLALLLIGRRWRRAVPAAILALAFVWLFGGLFLPSPQPVAACAGGEQACGVPLRVMTYNLLGDDRPDVAAQVRLMRDSGADVIALQEVSERAAAEIERGLADVYPYRVLYPLGIPGTGLLSKYPILEEQSIHLRTSLLSLRATLYVNGTPVTVISAHPPPPSLSGAGYSARGNADTADLADMITAGGPGLLLGDFNATDQSSAHALIRETGLYDAFREAGWGYGPTWPSRAGGREYFPPVVRIDYIWHTDHFRATRAWVGGDAGSDHLPVLAALVLTLR